MPKDRPTDVTGDIGAYLAATVLAPISTVEPRGETMELDYYCELRGHPGCVFHVQAKGSENPTYSSNMISSLPIKRTSIEDYWLKQPYPVYVLMSDVRARKTYQIRVSSDSYTSGPSKTFTFAIPLANELTSENAGQLVQEVLQHQVQLSAQEATRMAIDFQESHPLLCHDLDHIDAILEIMRGSDQHAQVQAKVAIQAMIKNDHLNSHRLENGLIEIFRNCKNRITQSHVLDTLVAVQSRDAVQEVIKQIDRNTRLYEYANTTIRSRYIQFLYHGLARLVPTNVNEDIKRLLEHPDPNVVRGAIWLIGELKLRGFVDKLIMALNHSDDSVRRESARTLTLLEQKQIVGHLLKLLDPSTPPLPLSAAISALEQSKRFDDLPRVVALRDHADPHVRAAVASYVGASHSDKHCNDLLVLAIDEDTGVSRQASRSIKQLSSLTDAQKEIAILPLLDEATRRGDEIQTCRLLGLLGSCATVASREAVVQLFRKSDGIPKTHEFYDHSHRVRYELPIDIKSQALEILRRCDISELHDEIVEFLPKCHPHWLSSYLDTCGEHRIQAAFEGITELPVPTIEECCGAVLRALSKIDLARTIDWATEIVRRTSSPFLMFRCSEFLHTHGIPPETVQGFRLHLMTLFAQFGNRCVPVLYDLIRKHQIVEAVPEILNDLELLSQGDPGRFDMPIYEMFQTLAVLDCKDGYEALVQLLPNSPPHFRKAILDDLARYRPELALPILRQYLKDPELEIRELCEATLDSLQTDKRNEDVDLASS